MGIKFFKDIIINDQVGGKGLSLAKMKQNGFNIPNGFVITTDVFYEFLKQNNVKNEIDVLVKRCDINSQSNIDETSEKIIGILNKCSISNLIEREIIKGFDNLNCVYVAVRSSATSEDGKENAWAGTLESFLNVDKGSIIDCVKKCWCSIFKPRALFYRLANGDNSDISVAVIIQKMIQSEISGVAFSANPTDNNTKEIIIEAGLGLGEAIVSGTITPDTYIVNKEKNIIVSKYIKNQKRKLVKKKNNNEYVLIKNGNIQKLNDKIILELSLVIKSIEEYYGFPVDIEWGIENNKIFILQSRPITTVKKNNLAETIINSGNWKFYVTRIFNWYIENTEIYASMKKYQKELLGFELQTLNYLCLNGDEYALDSDFEILCSKLDNCFENNINFFEKFANKEFEIVDRIKKYLTDLTKINLKLLTFEQLKIEFENFNKLYIESFIPGMTRPEDYLMDKLKKELTDLKVDKNDIDIIFNKVCTCPNYAPLSYSEEPLELLKIAKQIRENKKIDELIEKHIKMYSWMKNPVGFEDTAFKKEDYMQRLENLLEIDIDAKIENILNVRKNNDIEYENILKQYNFNEKALKLIKAIRDFIFLRTYTTEYSDRLFFEFRHTILKEISIRTNIKEDDLIMMDDKEIISILNSKGVLSKEIKCILQKRKLGFAMIWLDGSIKTVFGKESNELQNIISNTFKTAGDKNDTNFDNNIISGNIANKGKVRGIARILRSYSDIYKVNKGDIIVANMTTPDFVSAMEKAAGFITDEGGITCHAAILSREFDVPCIVGTVDATEKIEDGETIELDAYNGKVYKLD